MMPSLSPKSRKVEIKASDKPALLPLGPITYTCMHLQLHIHIRAVKAYYNPKQHEQQITWKNSLFSNFYHIDFFFSFS